MTHESEEKMLFLVELLVTIVAVWEFLHDFNIDLNEREQFNG
jgi:hypothetical protein